MYVLILSNGLFPPSLHGSSSDYGNIKLEYWSNVLNVIVFESQNVKNQLPKNKSEVVVLKSADLPLRLSKAYFSLSNSVQLSTEDLGMSGDLVLLDVNTFVLPMIQIEKSKPEKRKNTLADLSYSLKVQDWTEDSCQIMFAGDHNGKLSPVVAQLSRKATTRIRVNRLCFVFTFVKAAIETDEMMRSAHNPNERGIIFSPKPIRQPLPTYPPELVSRRMEGNFRFLGILTEQGTVDRSTGIVLECFHGLFAHNALEIILSEWKFAPGQLNYQPVKLLCNIEVSFRLRQ